MRPACLLVCLIGGLTSCARPLDPLPFDVEVTVDSAVVGPHESVKFVVTAAGGAILDIAIDYGDHIGEHYPTAPARTLLVRFEHEYAAAGHFTIRATATDVSYGNRSATLDVTVH
jgi:PKD domain-containing protein